MQRWTNNYVLIVSRFGGEGQGKALETGFWGATENNVEVKVTLID